MRKRILCAMFALLMVVTLLPSVVGADETSVIDLAFTQRETAVGARYVTVGVDMNGNPGFVSATIPVKWDNSVLHLKSVSLSDDIVASESWAGMSMDEYTSNGTYYLSWNNDTREAGDFTTATGCLAELEFEIVDPSVDTSTQLQFDMTDRIANIMNFNMVDLNKTNTVTANPATITVTAQTSGGDTPDPDPVDPNAATITVNSVTKRVGEEVDVEIYIKNNPGVVCVTFDVTFDQSVLTLTGVEDGGIIGGAQHSNNYVSPYRVSWNDDTAIENYTQDGKIITLKFKIKEEAPVGNYPITISYEGITDANMNFDMDGVDFTMVAGSVGVIQFIYGDVNGDGEVTNKDKMVLGRTLAKWTGYSMDDIDTNAADVNADGEVTNKDKMILGRYLAKWTGYETLPYEK